jgi:SPP1 family predicted phage head-tail adaptor
MTATGIARLYNRDVEVQRIARTTDSQGGWTSAYSSLETVKGRIRPVSYEERVVGGQERATVTHVLYVATTTDIQRSDHVIIDSLTYLVDAVRTPSVSDHHLEVDLVIDQTGG